jgi:dihydropteroate synthase
VGGFFIHKAVQNKLFSGNKILRFGTGCMDLSQPKVMGILNVTPDSFYASSRALTASAILKHTEKMASEGADFIDIGGYSSRPGADDIPEEEEWNRVLPAIQSIRKEFPRLILSIDTFRSSIARKAIHEGCDMINDISAGQRDSKMFQLAADLRVPYVAMHMRGTPQTMTQLTGYDNLMKEVIDYFHRVIHDLTQAGVSDVLIDPGFGFAKTVDQNFELLKHLDQLHILEKPLLVGLSRKSMIWRTLQTNPHEALNGTAVLHTLALLKGASILRVHDVKEAREVITLVNRMQP